MKGIIVDDFEMILKKGNYNISLLSDDILKIKSNLSSLSSNISNTDLLFFINNLSLEVRQFENLIIKTSSYQKALNNVLMSYKYQLESIENSVRKLTL